MEYHVTYEDLDKHWIVSNEHEIIMRFPSREQAETFVEKRYRFLWDTENNSEKEGWLIFDKSLKSAYCILFYFGDKNEITRKTRR